MLSTLAATDRPGAELAGRWLWLFPATYLVHILEEYVAGFPSWFSGVAGITFTPAHFLVLNAALWLFMAGAVRASLHHPTRVWMPVALGSLALANSLLHLGGSVVTRSYSPGAVSAGLFWAPLGSITLYWAKTHAGWIGLVGGILAGLAVHAVVSLLALNSSWLFA